MLEWPLYKFLYVLHSFGNLFNNFSLLILKLVALLFIPSSLPSDGLFGWILIGLLLFEVFLMLLLIKLSRLRSNVIPLDNLPLLISSVIWLVVGMLSFISISIWFLS